MWYFMVIFACSYDHYEQFILFFLAHPIKDTTKDQRTTQASSVKTTGKWIPLLKYVIFTVICAYNQYEQLVSYFWLTL
jgi:hypothetical protein